MAFFVVCGCQGGWVPPDDAPEARELVVTVLECKKEPDETAPRLRSALEGFRSAPECQWGCQAEVTSLLKETDPELLCVGASTLARRHTAALPPNPTVGDKMEWWTAWFTTSNWLWVLALLFLLLSSRPKTRRALAPTVSGTAESDSFPKQEAT